MITDIMTSQLDDNVILNKEKLEQIAGLIYDTDPYIYPALFGKRQNAMKLLPAILANGKDDMFSLRNVYVASWNGRIVGLILWKKGVMRWTPKILLDMAKKLQVEVSEHLKYVNKMYLSKYNLEDCRRNISLINMCVSENMRGIGIGTRLLHDFLNENKGEIIKLCVLKNNKNAVNMYQHFGFTVVKEYQGFSTEQLKPDCIEMILDH